MSSLGSEVITIAVMIGCDAVVFVHVVDWDRSEGRYVVAC